MNKKDIILGCIAGFIASLFGCYLFIFFFTNFDFLPGILSLKSEGKLGKLITLGSLLDLVLFAVLLKMNKELMARGVVLAVIIITILTLFA